MHIKKQTLIIIRTLVIVGGVLALIILILGPHKDQSKTISSDSTKRVSYTGQLESLDLTGMATDAPGIYKVRVGNALTTVNLDAGESACDRAAIQVPDVKTGDRVEISGDLGVDGVVQVCAAGTYIKVSR